MCKYSQFLADYQFAEEYYRNEVQSKYPGLFLKSFETFCNKIYLDYDITHTLERVCITTKTFQINLTLNDDCQIERALVQGMGDIVKGIRDSIWETKTFFGVPVFAVLNTSSDDESVWEVFPRQFMVMMITKEIL